jgi:curved DNA-binding protein CbpA
MASPQRPGEITYYEELGVENTASADEIRDAFRALARLLHPDQQTDPQLKEIAERQMRKLNRVHGVLSDVSRRAAYDESLRTSRNAPIIVFSGSDGNVKKLLAAIGTAGAATATEMSELQVAAGAVGVNEPAGKSAQFAGLWVYAKASGSAVSPGGKSQYAPEYIEVTMTEVNGALHGEYRSRYQVLDHAISPDVNFDFNGKPVGSSLSCPWRGPGGAQGRLTVRLLPASTVEIAWNATQLGSQQWLINGTATLVRK